MIHLTPQQISSFLDGELTEASTELVRLHLASCEDCTLAYARAEEQAEQLARVLAHDPGAEYFAGFAATVEQLIHVGKVEPQPKNRSARVVPVEPAPAPAPAVESSATERPAPPPALEAPIEPSAQEHPPSPPVAAPAEPVRSVRRRRESDRRPVPAIPWYVAAILVVIAGSVGVMVSRIPPHERPAEEPPPSVEPPAPKVESPEPGLVAPATPEPETGQPIDQANAETLPATEEAEPERLVPEPMRTLMPVTRVVTVVETTRAAPSASERPAATRPSLVRRTPAPLVEPDPFAALLAELQARVTAARRATAHAYEDPTAAHYESAAAAWESVVADLRGHAAQPRARFQLASARYRAWEMHPDARRAAAAVAALRLHLVYAVPGTERDSSKTRLARLSH